MDIESTFQSSSKEKEYITKKALFLTSSSFVYRQQGHVGTC